MLGRLRFAEQEFCVVDALDAHQEALSNLHVLLISCESLETYKRTTHKTIKEWLAKTPAKNQFHVIIQVTSKLQLNDALNTRLKQIHSSNLALEQMAMDFEPYQNVEIIQLRINEHHEGNWTEIISTLDASLSMAVVAKIGDLKSMADRLQLGPESVVEGFSEIFLTTDKILALYISAGVFGKAAETLESMETLLKANMAPLSCETDIQMPSFQYCVSDELAAMMKTRILSKSPDPFAYCFYFAHRLISTYSSSRISPPHSMGVTEDRIASILAWLVTVVVSCQSRSLSTLHWGASFCIDAASFIRSHNDSCTPSSVAPLLRLGRRLLLSSLILEFSPESASFLELAECILRKSLQESKKPLDILASRQNQPKTPKEYRSAQETLSILTELTESYLSYLYHDSPWLWREILLLRLELASSSLILNDLDKAADLIGYVRSCEHLSVEWYHLKHITLRLQELCFTSLSDRKSRILCKLEMWALIKSHRQGFVDEDLTQWLGYDSTIAIEAIEVPMDSFFDFVSIELQSGDGPLSFVLCLQLKFPFKNPATFNYLGITLDVSGNKHMIDAHDVSTSESRVCGLRQVCLGCSLDVSLEIRFSFSDND